MVIVLLYLCGIFMLVLIVAVLLSVAKASKDSPAELIIYDSKGRAYSEEEIAKVITEVNRRALGPRYSLSSMHLTGGMSDVWIKREGKRFATMECKDLSWEEYERVCAEARAVTKILNGEV